MKFFDLHCDTAVKAYETSQNFFKNDLAIDFYKGSVFDEWHQCFAIWINDSIEHPYKYYKSVLSDFNLKINKAPENLKPYLTVENALILENDLSRVCELKNDSVKAITLTWNGENCIASGVCASGGLKPFGEQVINELNRLKIACDLSHINNEGFFAAVELAEYPIATHSCCDAVVTHRRNLTDKQILKIAEKDGIIGLCLYPEFCGKDICEGTYNNILHLISLGFEENISVGTDFDGCDMPPEISDVSKIKKLYCYLVDKGLSEETLDKIFYQNALNFFAKL